MAEGGFFPWKVQKVQAVPTFDYSKLAVPLEEPPKGLQWVRDVATREWHLVSSTDCKGNSDGTVIPASSAPPEIKATDQEPVVAVAVEVDTGVPIDLAAVAATHVVDVDHVTCENVIYHKVQPTDTIQGLCIRYKVTPTQLRQWNRFTGSNLLLAPDILIIRVETVDPSPNLSSSKDWKQSEKNRKVQKFLLILENKTGIPYSAAHKLSLSPMEAQAYIDMYDGNVEKAVEGAIHDLQWEGQK